MTAKRDSRGHWVKGEPSPNPGGRPRVLADIQELARERAPAAIDALTEIVSDPAAPPAARVSAANSLLDRGFGKPHQTTEATVSLTQQAGETAEERRARLQTEARTMMPALLSRSGGGSTSSEGGAATAS